MDKNYKWLQIKDIPTFIKKRTGLVFSKDMVRHWIIKGRKSESGKTILLRATKKLGTWLTTEQWVDEFIEESSK